MTMLLPGPPSSVSTPGPPRSRSSSGAAEEHVVTGAAEQDVVAVAAVLGEANRGGRERGCLDDVVAGTGLDGQPIVRRLRSGDVHARGEPEHRRAGRVARDVDHVVAGRAVHDHVVRCAVAGAAGRGEIRVHLGEVGPADVVDRERVGAAERPDVDASRRRSDPS